MHKTKSNRHVPHVITLVMFTGMLFASPPASASPVPQIYWMFDNNIERIGIDGTQRQSLLTGLPGGWGVDVSPVLGKMYWATRTDGKIMRSNLDGSAPEVIATGLGDAQDVAIDDSAGYIYWSDSDLDKIQRADLNGANVVDIITGVGFTTCLHLDTPHNKIYFSESATDTVRRANLDGSDQEIVLTSLGSADPRGVAVDHQHGHLYYSDLKRDGIFRADLDGTNEVPFVTGLDQVFDIQISRQTGELYWFENSTRALYRSPLGTAAPSIVTTNARAWGMTITPEPSVLALMGFGVMLFARRSR